MGKNYCDVSPGVPHLRAAFARNGWRCPRLRSMTLQVEQCPIAAHHPTYFANTETSSPAPPTYTGPGNLVSSASACPEVTRYVPQQIAPTINSPPSVPSHRLGSFLVTTFRGRNEP